MILSGYLTPSFAAQQLRNQRYYRAEVHLFEGSQDYDLVGYSPSRSSTTSSPVNGTCSSCT